MYSGASKATVNSSKFRENRRMACLHFCRRSMSPVSAGAGMFGWRATQVHARITTRQLRTISHADRVPLCAAGIASRVKVLLKRGVGSATVLDEASEYRSRMDSILRSLSENLCRSGRLICPELVASACTNSQFTAQISQPMVKASNYRG